MTESEFLGTDDVEAHVSVSFSNGSSLSVTVRYPSPPTSISERVVATRALDEARAAVRAVITDQPTTVPPSPLGPSLRGGAA